MSADATVRLFDGRTVAFREWGDPRGATVIYFHGLPGSRFECWGGGAAYASLAVRLITVDRPGIGRSDRQSGRAVGDWPNDVVQLADALGLERFAVMGHSAGAAYALACAHRLAGRVSGVALIGAVPPLDHPDRRNQLATARYWEIARSRPRLMASGYRALARALATVPRLGHRAFFRHASGADRAALESSGARERFRASVREAVRQGGRGLVDDMRVLMRPWGFRPAEIATAVNLWHGSDDAHVPLSASQVYAAELPNSRLRLVPNEGHFSLAERCAPQVAAAVAGDGVAAQ